MAWPTDLVRTKDWVTEVMTDADLEGQFDLIIDWLMAFANETTGHDHSAAENKAPKIDLSTGAKIASQALGDIFYASSSTAIARLAGNITTTKKFLRQTGDGAASAAPAWDTLVAGDLPDVSASQAEMEAASSNSKYATPGRLQYHPGVAKAWVLFDGTGTPTVTVSHNVDSSITDNGTGDYTISWTTDFSSANYAVIGTALESDGGANPTMVSLYFNSPLAAGTTRVQVALHDGNLKDVTKVSLVAFGDQA